MDTTIFKKYFFCPQKEKKTPSKVAQEASNPLFFPYRPERQPQHKSSSSKLWLIDQLYIELGLKVARKGKTTREFVG